MRGGGEGERVHRIEKSWICHKVWQSNQGVGSEKEDRPLQEVCYGAEDVAGEVELEDR